MKPIGGYFELELPSPGGPLHPEALAFSTGRACLSAILEAMRPTRVHAPLWCCRGACEPILRESIPIARYAIGENLEPRWLPEVGPDELILLINAFGVLDELASRLAETFCDRLVVDNTQAFFSRGVSGAWAFNSARKFVGVPDGAYLYPARPIAAPTTANTRFNLEHLLLRLEGDPEKGYASFQQNEILLDRAQTGMSALSSRVLASVDYRSMAEIRRRNYLFLHSQLGRYNQLNIHFESASVPMCYPWLPSFELPREHLISRRIFVPRFWQSVLDHPETGHSWELDLADRLLPLPIDQRYGIEEMERIVEVISEAAPGGAG